MNFLQKQLGNLSLRTKILLLSSLFILGIIMVALVGAGVIYQQGKIVREAVASSQARVTAASSASMAIVEMNAAINALLAADDKASIRPAAIGSIRASSFLDEHIQNLQTALPESTKVQQLAELLKQMKPSQMKIIRDGKRNKDIEGLEKLKGISSLREKIKTTAEALVTEEREHLGSQLAKSEQDGQHAIMALGGFVLLGILFGVAISLFAAHLLTKPLINIEKVMAAVADGDLHITLDTGGKDEVGRMTDAISSTVETLNRVIRGVIDNSSMLTSEAQGLIQVAETIHDATMQQHDSVRQIRDESTLVLSSTTDAMTMLNDAATKAQQAADTTTTSSNEIGAVMKDFQRFQGDMEQTAQSTQELARAAEQITMITKTIRGISEQTNLLALNAAIEAARAGEQGRGFAVVADEVRSLAGRTSDATDEISKLIEHMSSSVKMTVNSLESTVTESRCNIERLDEVAKQTSESSEQSRQTQAGMKEVVQIMASQEDAVQRITGTVGALLEQAGNTNTQADSLSRLSTDLNGAASGMQEMVKHFKVDG